MTKKDYSSTLYRNFKKAVERLEKKGFTVQAGRIGSRNFNVIAYNKSIIRFIKICEIPEGNEKAEKKERLSLEKIQVPKYGVKELWVYSSVGIWRIYQIDSNVFKDNYFIKRKGVK